MKVIKTKIPDVLIFEPAIYLDDRGFFYESFNQKQFETAVNKNIQFVQDNQSRSKKGVLRGLHYQLPPYEQGKLVRAIHGHIFDVAIDIRKSSETFGCWIGVDLSEDNRRQLWIPEGFAHGFLVLSEFAEILYKTTFYYEPKAERSINWADADLGIVWPVTEKLFLSENDKAAGSLKSLEIFP